jgi:hypothetical protein
VHRLGQEEGTGNKYPVTTFWTAKVQAHRNLRQFVRDSTPTALSVLGDKLELNWCAAPEGPDDWDRCAGETGPIPLHRSGQGIALSCGNGN